MHSFHLMLCPRSYDYMDELGWSAIWLYKATGEGSYLDKAISFFDGLNYAAWAFDWDDKNTGYQVRRILLLV